MEEDIDRVERQRGGKVAADRHKRDIEKPRGKTEGHN
jgi:hypothetical protein